MTPIVEHDSKNGRVVTMWDECGMRFRDNIVSPGGRIEMHSHSFDHVAAVWGRFRMTVGNEVTEVSRGKYLVPAGLSHSFEYLGLGEVGEVLCFWPIGRDGAE
jgi:quercetin dioxygenase-like cupin family protein